MTEEQEALLIENNNILKAMGGNTCLGFDGTFDVSQGTVFHDDYTDGLPLDLTLSAVRVKGSIARVRIKSTLINSLSQELLDGLSGDPIENENPSKMNELTVLYVSDTDINLVNRVSPIITVGFELEYQAMLDYALANSFELPTLQQQIIDNEKVRLLKEAGIWHKLDKAHIFNSTYTASSFAVNFYRINWADPNKYLLSNDADFVSGKGFTGGSGKYLGTGFTPSTDMVKGSLNDWGEIIGVFNHPTNYPGVSWWYGGRSAAHVQDQCMLANASSGKINARLGSSDLKSNAQDEIDGHYHFIRDNVDSVKVAVYKNGLTELIQSGNTTHLATDLPSEEQIILGFNDQGTTATNTTNLGANYHLTGRGMAESRLDIFNILNIRTI